MTAPAFQPIHSLAADITARRLSPVDLVDECLSRIQRLEPKLHAFVPVMPSGRSTAFPSPSRTSWRSKARWSRAAVRPGKIARPPGLQP
jgi:Asp-tRNA(Asn)/Glu-tRNA(Gln) amidotransferase A subunit family amidase